MMARLDGAVAGRDSDDSDNLYVASAYAQLFIRASQLPVETLLRETGLTEQSLLESSYISQQAMSSIMHKIDDLSHDPAWAARAGALLSSASHGPMGFAALCAPTLGEAMQVMAEFHPVRINSFSVDIIDQERSYSLVLHDRVDDLAYARWMNESVLKVLESILEAIIGHPPGKNVSVQFNFDRPAHGSTLEAVFSAELLYGCQHSAIVIPASWWGIRSPLADEDSYYSNIAKCRGLLADLARDQNAVALVSHLLAQHFDEVLSATALREFPPSLSDIAQGLFITPRTLIRRLASEQSSYKLLLEQNRNSYAQRLLRTTQLSVAEIAQILGYREPANFGRAFKSWLGVTPGVWRKQG